MVPPAFLTPTFTPTFTSARAAHSALSTRPSRPSKHTPPARIVCAAATTEKSSSSSKKKKEAPIVFANDLKGNFVWTLRGAEEEDIDTIASFFSEVYPRELIEAFVTDSGSCTVCEASVKGTKEGEGYKGRIMGAALVDLEVAVKDPTVGFESGFAKIASVRGTFVDQRLPSAEDVRKKLLLGAMKKLKGNDAAKIVTDIDSSDEKVMQMLKACLFKAKGTGGSRVDMSCDLLAENPDPEKKML